MQPSNQNIFLTGYSVLSWQGFGFERRYEPSALDVVQKIKDVPLIQHLSDRKVFKVVSHRDVLGLVAFETCVKNSGIARADLNPDRVGMYVGAPPSSVIDTHNYDAAVAPCSNAYGELDARKFGETFRAAPPTTLLNGLPNNVLCYGSKTLDARGPNSNYTALDISAHLAMIQAMRALKVGRLDMAMVGGYSSHTDEVVPRMVKAHFQNQSPNQSLMQETPWSEGAVFVSLEATKQGEKPKGTPIAKILHGVAVNGSSGPFCLDQVKDLVEELVESLLEGSHLAKGDIGIVALSGVGLSDIDGSEIAALHEIFKDTPASGRPALMQLSRRIGHLCEASGIAEIPFMSMCLKERNIDQDVRLMPEQWGKDGWTSKNKAIVIRTSLSQEITGLICELV
jgi:3-oxoacyl-(acyl-carrier-protein) synthase